MRVLSNADVALIHCRYASQCLMIEFSVPPLSLTLSEYMELVATILPDLSTRAAVSPRILLSYSILYWFTLQVSTTVLVNPETDA